MPRIVNISAACLLLWAASAASAASGWSALARWTGASVSSALAEPAKPPGPAGAASLAPVVPVPVSPRLINAPTAHLQPSGQLYATAGAFVLPDRTPFLGFTLGLGGVADVDIEVHDRNAVCIGCTDDERAAESITTASAAFKMGLPEGFYTPWQPAVSLGLRTSVSPRKIDFAGQEQGLESARMFLVATSNLGPLELTLGADAWDAKSELGDAAQVLHDQPLRERLRPFGGVSISPPAYPRTRLLADLSWAPVFGDSSVGSPADDGSVELRWLFGWGVRYQALSWGSIELDVRHREGGSLGDSEVTIRLNGSWNLLSSLR